jgi:hypothetical protein
MRTKAFLIFKYGKLWSLIFVDAARTTEFLGLLRKQRFSAA